MSNNSRFQQEDQIEEDERYAPTILKFKDYGDGIRWDGREKRRDSRTVRKAGHKLAQRQIGGE